MEDNCFIPQATKDGSYTFFSPEFGETFHSSFGAKQEAEVRYVEPCLIKQLATQKSTIRILDVCYGLGYNSAAALEAIWSVNPQCKVELMALEITADVPRQAIAHNLLAQWQPFVSERLAQLGNNYSFNDELLVATLMLGDARQTISTLIEMGWQADAIFFDPFSPPKCPQLWTVEFIALVAQCLGDRGRLATYSCSAAVRTAFLAANLNITSITGAGRKSPGTLAVRSSGLPPCPKGLASRRQGGACLMTHSASERLSALPLLSKTVPVSDLLYKPTHKISIREREHLKTRAAVPYRDPTLVDRAETIIKRRRVEQEDSIFEPTSQWRKRWFK